MMWDSFGTAKHRVKRSVQASRGRRQRASAAVTPEPSAMRPQAARPARDVFRDVGDMGVGGGVGDAGVGEPVVLVGGEGELAAGGAAEGEPGEVDRRLPILLHRKCEQASGDVVVQQRQRVRHRRSLEPGGHEVKEERGQRRRDFRHRRGIRRGGDGVLQRERADGVDRRDSPPRVPHERRGQREMARGTRPGGRCGLSDRDGSHDPH